MKHIRKIASVICIILSLPIVMASFSSCIILDYLFNYQGYSGEHTDLYTVAVNNIFAIDGFTNNGEAVYDPDITVIETDNYGRTLFFYNESFYETIDYRIAFVIMQKAEDGYAYYYQDICYTNIVLDESCYPQVGEEDYNSKLAQNAAKLSKDTIEALKEVNDWNSELCLDKCTKSKIHKDKPDGHRDISTFDFTDAVFKYAKENGYENADFGTCRFFRFCNYDSDGKGLYYVYYSVSFDKENDKGTDTTFLEYAVIVTPGEYSWDFSIKDGAIAEIKDPTKAKEIVKELKEQNDWK